MVQDGVGVIYLFVGKFLQLYDQKKTLLHDIQFGGSQVISSGSVAAFQPLPLPFPLILDLHPGGKNPDSNGIEMKVLRESTLCTRRVLLLKLLCPRTQAPRPKSSF